MSLWSVVARRFWRPRYSGRPVWSSKTAQLDHYAGVEFARVGHQRALGFCDIGGRHAGGQHVEGMAHGADVVLADGARFDRGRQLGQLRRHRRTGQRAPRPDPGRQLEAANDLSRRRAQPRPQRLPHRRDGLAAIGWLGDLFEEPIHQPTVGALLGLQPLGHRHPEIVAHLIRAGLTQHRIPSIDGIKSGPNPPPRLLGTHTPTHAPTLKTTPVKTPAPGRRHCWPVDKQTTVDNSRSWRNRRLTCQYEKSVPQRRQATGRVVCQCPVLTSRRGASLP
jgi:hypothetical protein